MLYTYCLSFRCCRFFLKAFFTRSIKNAALSIDKEFVAFSLFFDPSSILRSRLGSRTQAPNEFTFTLNTYTTVEHFYFSLRSIFFFFSLRFNCSLNLLQICHYRIKIKHVQFIIKSFLLIKLWENFLLEQKMMKIDSINGKWVEKYSVLFAAYIM